MQFTRLKLSGFKSFVEPAELKIEPGLTGVVGPNGCGKSNLLEAIRWVMGEGSARSLRGGGMEDVIFNGAAARGARHFAEVALVLENAERLAPAGFNDADQIEIVRRITRDAGSAYRLNGKDVRARDVQMLFADASTGAHSPALVRQGQIAELINARPKARRMVLEEAAGISGLYQRRHEAELKLQGADANLLRVDDVLEALAQQLSVLMRQARQALRYREIGEDLRRAEGQLLYRRWREADLARLQAEGGLRERLGLAAQAEGAAQACARLREATEAALPAVREEEAIAAAVLQRLRVERDQLEDEATRARAMIDTLEARIAELGRDAEREGALNRDAGEVIARLEWETAQLLRAHDGHDARLAAAVEAAQLASGALSAAEARLSEATVDSARLAARHQAAQRLIADNRATLQRADAEAGRARQAQGAAEGALTTAEAGHEEALQQKVAAVVLAASAEAALAEAEAARAQVQAREAVARAARSEAEGEANALGAEVAGLMRLVERESRSGAQLIDVLGVEPGYEMALGAALADDLRAPEVQGAQRSGWVRLPAYSDPQPLPGGVPLLAAFVTGPEVLSRRMSQIGLVEAGAGDWLQAALRPGQRLVSREGDLWRWDGFRAAAADAPQASALRLQQMNRLVRLRRDLDEVRARAGGAALAHAELQARLADLARADQLAREARRAADAGVAEANRKAARTEADGAIAAARLEAAALAVRRFEDEALAAGARLNEALASLEGIGDPDALRAAVDAARREVEAGRSEMLQRRSVHDDMRREGEARMRRHQEAGRELASWRARLQTAEKRAGELAARHAELLAERASALAAPGEIAGRRVALSEAMTVAEARRATAAEAMARAEAALRGAREAEREAERLAGEAREARARAEARLDAQRDTLALAVERIAEETGATPAQLLETLAVDPQKMPDVAALDTDVQRLKRQREALGAVNLRAEEDAQAVNAEYDALAREKGDLEEAVKKLRAGIAGLNREGRERLLTAFEQVNTNFTALFTHLFGGGAARLELVESDDPLEAGLEIMCQPPGKKLAALSLLSGGEQTLTALALIFAVFLANPAPICVLDEVDAPLDDANVTRFCDLLDEMTRRTDTRFLIITHHAVTMARMDRLFGVTMAEPGVSQLVSVDLRKAAAMVA